MHMHVLHMCMHILHMHMHILHIHMHILHMHMHILHIHMHILHMNMHILHMHMHILHMHMYILHMCMYLPCLQMEMAKGDSLNYSVLSNFQCVFSCLQYIPHSMDQSSPIVASKYTQYIQPHSMF